MPKMLTADKAIDVLEAVAAAPNGMGTREMARSLELSVATVHNLAKTLEMRGYLRQDKQSKRFHLGLRLMLMGRHDHYLDTLAGLARPFAESVGRELDESVMLGVLDHGQVINLQYIPSRQALRVQEPEDLRSVAYCTAIGKVMLAHMPAAELETYLDSTQLQAFTSHTIASRDALRRELSQTRERGYGMTTDELCDGVSAVAVPIRDPWGSTIASIGASAPTIRMNAKGERERVRRALQVAAVEIERAWASTGQKGR